jgi:hypothetical protein
MVPPDPPIAVSNSNKKVPVERQVIDESGGKNRKNPSENTSFLFQNDPQDVCLA